MDYKRSVGGEISFEKEFVAKMDEISRYANSGSYPRQERLKMLGYRTKLVQNYIVFYMIFEDHVELEFIYNQRRNYLKRIK